MAIHVVYRLRETGWALARPGPEMDLRRMRARLREEELLLWLVLEDACARIGEQAHTVALSEVQAREAPGLATVRRERETEMIAMNKLEESTLEEILGELYARMDAVILIGLVKRTEDRSIVVKQTKGDPLQLRGAIQVISEHLEELYDEIDSDADGDVDEDDDEDEPCL